MCFLGRQYGPIFSLSFFDVDWQRMLLVDCPISENNKKDGAKLGTCTKPTNVNITSYNKNIKP
jgi:hypothetical protein